MTGGADSWSQPSVFPLFHCGRLVYIFMTIASYFAALFDLLERASVGDDVGSRVITFCLHLFTLGRFVSTCSIYLELLFISDA